jgi:site-specific recombinase XerD
MTKDELQSVIINQVAQSYLIQCKLSAIEIFLSRILSDDLIAQYEITKENRKKMNLSLANAIEFFVDAPEENQLVRERLKDLFELLY